MRAASPPPTPPAATLTLGQLCRESGLARASLLNYERLGLLLPLRRSPAGYRLYGPEQLERLRGIRRLREAGLPLHEIALLLPVGGRSPAGPGIASPQALLKARLQSIADEVQRLRAQQRQLARLLAASRPAGETGAEGKSRWVALLRRAGFDAADMRRWHAEFEADDPAAHAEFLASLHLGRAEIAAIRRAARAARQD